MLDETNSPQLVYDAEDEYVPEPVPPPLAPVWQDGSFRIGIHTSIAGDIARSLDIAKKLGCNAMQIFSSSPRMWPRPGRSLIPEADAARFRQRRRELALFRQKADRPINLRVDPGDEASFPSII